jgi:ArsR family transcriptional regulator
MNLETHTPRNSETLVVAAQLFKALGEPIRLRMLNLLRHGELCVCDLMAVLDLPQSTASRHLAYLRNTGWLTARRQNKWIYYRFDTGVVDPGLFTAVLTLLNNQNLEEDNQGLNNHLATKNQNSC